MALRSERPQFCLLSSVLIRLRGPFPEIPPLSASPGPSGPRCFGWPGRALQSYAERCCVVRPAVCRCLSERHSRRVRPCRVRQPAGCCREAREPADARDYWLRRIVAAYVRTTARHFAALRALRSLAGPPRRSYRVCSETASCASPTPWALAVAQTCVWLGCARRPHPGL